MMTKPYGSNLLFALGILATLALAGCSESGAALVAAPQTATAEAALVDTESRVPGADASARLLALADQYMAQQVDASPYLQLLAGRRVEKLADNSFAFAEAQAASAREALVELATIDASLLDHDDGITHAILQSLLELGADYPQHFWHKFNVTPYAAGTVVNSVLGSGAMPLPVLEEHVDWYMSRH